jgi:hypothetical protein
MKRFVAGADRGQSTLLPECLDDFIDESNPVHVIDAFVDALELAELGFASVEPAATGRPSYHPSVPLKLYIYGYLNRVAFEPAAGTRSGARGQDDVGARSVGAGPGRCFSARMSVGICASRPTCDNLG